MAWMCRRVGGRECDCCMECVGGEEGIQPECVICGSTNCDYFYFKDDEPIGCDDCIRREAVW